MVTVPDNFITSLSLFVLSTNQKFLKLGLLYINNLCLLEHGELEHKLNNCCSARPCPSDALSFLSICSSALPFVTSVDVFFHTCY